MQKKYRDWPLWERIFYPAFLALMGLTTFLTKGNYLALAASLLCFTGATLNTKVRWEAYAYNAVGSLLYGIVAIQTRNYGEMLISILYNTPCYVWALLKWRRRDEKASSDASAVLHLPRAKLIWLSILCTVGVIAYSVLLWKVGSRYPVANAIATGACVLAIYLASNRCIEQWLFWTIYNISLMVIWMPTSQAQLANIALEINSIGYIVLSTNGWLCWHALRKTQASEKGTQAQ